MAKSEPKSLKLKEKKYSGDNVLKVTSKKFTMNDIHVDHKDFRNVLIPTYFDFMMLQYNPFKTRDTNVLDGLQTIWEKVFPMNAEKLTFDCPIKFVVRIQVYMFWNIFYQKASQADQRFYEYRRRFSDIANKTVAKFFKGHQSKNPLLDDEWRRNYVERALSNRKNPAFLWKSFPLQIEEVNEVCPV